MDLSNFLDNILAGMYDDSLSLIEKTISQRKDSLSSRMVNTLNSGDVVTLANVRPKYLVGLDATVVSVMGDKVSVRIQDSPKANRFRNSVVTIKKDMISI
jgi:protein involved in polysaccharide export with SLBB domain